MIVVVILITIQLCCWEQSYQIHGQCRDLTVGKTLNSSAQQALERLSLKAKTRTREVLGSEWHTVKERPSTYQWGGKRNRRSEMKEKYRGGKLWASGICVDVWPLLHLSNHNTVAKPTLDKTTALTPSRAQWERFGLASLAWWGRVSEPVSRQ